MHAQIQWRTSWLLSGMTALSSAPTTFVQDTRSYQDQWIIERSKETLSGHTADEAAAWSSTQKKQWWKQRVHLDGQLKLLVDKALAHLSFYRSLSAPAESAAFRRSILCGCHLEATPDAPPSHQEIVASLMYTFATHLLNEDLVNEGLKHCGIASSPQLLPPRSAAMTTPPGLTLLSTNIHAFPWEGLFPPGFPVSRLQSLGPLFDPAQSTAVSRRSVHYVVNPGGDLLHTAQYLDPFLSKGRSEWQWTTSDDAADAAACFAKDVFLYCGHGSGERYVGRQVVAQLTKCPVAVLMGCSSAKLTPFGVYEPEGMLASYVDAKSPAVVGMLWDVTDRDLDRPTDKINSSIGRGFIAPSAHPPGAIDFGCYVGGVSNRLRHGQGNYAFPRGYFKYTGDWHLGKMHGHGIFFLGDGSTYEGTFVNGEIQGMGLRRWPDGTTYSGEFFRGEMHGEGTYIASSGKKYEGAWRDNQYHGYGELTDADQSLYEGHFDHHKPHGIGRKTWPDKTTYEGEWQHGKCHGHGRWIALDGTSYEGDWAEGNRHGVGKGVWTNGLIYDGPWTCNVRDKVPTCIVVTRLAPDGTTPDPSPLVFRELPPVNPADEGAGAVGDVIPPTLPPVPPVKILPSFQLACCMDGEKAKSILLDQSNQTSSGSTEGGAAVEAPTMTVVEESRHGIRMSLFQGKSPADVARDAAIAAAADADAKDKRKKSTAVDLLAPTGDPTPPLLTTLIDPATQTAVVEWVVHTSHGLATIPSLQLPTEAAPGDYFLQFDSTVDAAIPSAYYGFAIVRGDDPGLDKAGSKKDVPKKK